MVNVVYKPREIIASLSSLTTAEIKKVLSRAGSDSTAGRIQVAAAAEAELRLRDAQRSAAETFDDGLPVNIVKAAWDALILVEKLITATNPVGKNGRPRKHRLSRTRQMIKRWGVKGALERIESKDSVNAIRNMQTIIEAGRSDLLWEEIVLRNPEHFDPRAVRAIYEFACEHFARFGITPTDPF